MDAIKEILIEIALIIIPVVGAFLVIFIKKKTRELAERTKDIKQKKYIDIAGEVVRITVERLNQTLVDELKQSNIDGKLTSDEIKNVSIICKDTVCRTLNGEAIDALKEVYGDLDEWLKSKVESTINQEKKAV